MPSGTNPATFVSLRVRRVVELRTLLAKMAFHDLQAQFAGSVMGVVWSFVHPLVMALVLWFVFGGASAGPGKTWLLPLLLVAVLLAAGIIVPCFLIDPIEKLSSDAINKVGNSLDSSTMSEIMYMLY